LAARSVERSTQAILLDIEGTTTPIDFVYRTLFPYARARLEQFLRQHGDEPAVRDDLEALRAQHRSDASEHLDPPSWMDDSPDRDRASAATYGLWLMDRDSKCSALKSLQGKIWQNGYRMGELRGEVYPDVPPALARWSQEGKLICIYSSGSVLAQKLLFGSTAAGDLTRFFHAHFDTAVGPKQAPQSYSQIARTLAIDPPSILFISDVAKELDAARVAGMRTALCLRTEPSAQVASAHPAIHSFNELFSGS
jgi:enolase-phosphatase E1